MRTFGNFRIFRIFFQFNKKRTLKSFSFEISIVNRTRGREEGAPFRIAPETSQKLTVKGVVGLRRAEAAPGPLRVSAAVSGLFLAMLNWRPLGAVEWRPHSRDPDGGWHERCNACVRAA